MEEFWKHILLALMAIEIVRLYLKTRAAMKQRHKLELDLLSIKSIKAMEQNDASH